MSSGGQTVQQDRVGLPVDRIPAQTPVGSAVA